MDSSEAQLLVDDEEEVWELLNEIQLSFWIDLTEDDLAKCSTVGGLFDAILRNKSDVASPKCLTSFAFYRLRRSLAAISGLQRRTIQRRSVLRQLVPVAIRSEWRKKIETDLRLRVPPLRPGKAALCVHLAILVSVIALFTAAQLSNSLDAKMAFPLTHVLANPRHFLDV